jgi:hypothetical protein
MSEARKSIVIGGDLPPDKSLSELTLEERQWRALNLQRDRLLDFIIKIFGWLNGAVLVLVLVGIGCDQWNLTYHAADAANLHKEYVGQTVISALIAATVTQAGLAFVSITKFLFPSRADHMGFTKHLSKSKNPSKSNTL